jgi:hypothetical protein
MTSFAITGLFRSGTKFLAENMNRSVVWSVRHEVDKGPILPRQIERINKRFASDYYGEVNYKLLPIIDRLIVDKKGIVFRDPVEVWLSIVSWRHEQETRNMERRLRNNLQKIITSMPQMLKLAERDEYRAIEFSRMTTEPAYLAGVFAYFGVNDVAITTEITRTKIHSTAPESRRFVLEDFDNETRRKIFAAREAYVQGLRRLREVGKI